MKRLALVLAAFVLAACSAPLEAGTITHKWYEEASTTYIPIKTSEICSNINGVRYCTPIYTQMPVTDDEDWMIRIQECTDKCRHTDYRISRDRYETLTVGEFFAANG